MGSHWPLSGSVAYFSPHIKLRPGKEEEEEIGSPDQGQVPGVHVGLGAEGGQVGQVFREVLQSPAASRHTHSLHNINAQDEGVTCVPSAASPAEWKGSSPEVGARQLFDDPLDVDQSLMIPLDRDHFL
ncbi:hypothetical protein EYF80_063084 [Liparis tanakae]|uniref:Uncharacterized protein n=1 Tax=Liparis tanakae TaxID=230148 RepID=A0A4Z2EDF8_9TELE|nr:hypothetical protein EYF80_063084 [Liparis tanakae]